MNITVCRCIIIHVYYSSQDDKTGLSTTKGGLNRDSAQHIPRICSTECDNDNGTSEDKMRYIFMR